MIRAVLAFAVLPVTLASQGPQPQPALVRPELTGLLDFEAEHVGGVPKNWNGTPAGTFAVDGQIVHGGRWALRIERTDTSPGAFTSVSKTIPIDFTGTELEMRGFLRTEDVANYTGLWMREDGDGGEMLALDNMQRRQLKGTTGWAEYSITLPLNKAAKRLVFGVLSSGTGRAWADDLRLLVDGKALTSLPRVELPKTALDLDKEFDPGSGIALKELTKTQIANLAMLGKVWGFVKYHHPLVAAGKRHWDYDLFRVMPRVLAAGDAPAARSAVNEWIAALGAVPPCNPCASLADTDIHLRPPVAWLTDDVLGSELAATLRVIYRNRPSQAQFYVSLQPMVGNPSFDHEPAYGALKLPDAGYQLLTLYRFWNIVEYWFPYRDVIGTNWDDELTAFIPRIALAGDTETYKREVMALIARVNDTHANLWSSLDARPPTGACQIPITLRFVENQAVVTASAAGAPDLSSTLTPGDVVTAIDGVAVSELATRWSPYYAASNEPTRLRDLARSMTRGACGAAALTVSRDGRTQEIKVARIAAAESGTPNTHDRPGDTFRKLSPDVAYLKLSSVKLAEAASYIEKAAGTKGLVIDIRNYPSEFMVFALGSRLVAQPAPFVRFTQGDLANPGAFHWGPPLSLQPAAPHYAGKIVILVDEVSQSQAEYTTMAFRVAPNATVVGSTTAGADGNVSAIPLPGGLRSMISGIGVFYPDKKPTQRVGIVADIDAKPTVEGMRSGRDEVLEVALRQILGPDVPAAVIQQIARQQP